MLSEGFWDGVIRQREEGRNEYEFHLCATSVCECTVCRSRLADVD
jgi:hypothetical protein